MNLDNISELLNGKPSGDGILCLCPAHNDTNPSLSLSIDQEKLLWKCHAGCSQEQVRVALVERGILADNLGPKKRETAFQYMDEKGSSVVRRVIRVDLPDGTKRIFQKFLNKGVWKTTNNNVPTAPFRYFESSLDTKEQILLVEGENCVLALEKMGYDSTTTGSSTSWKSHHPSFFKGKKVIILPDNDQAGEKYAQIIKKDLKNVAKSVDILRLPELPQSGDIVDWIKLGGTAKRLRALITTLTQKGPSKKVPESLTLIRLSEVKTKEIKWL